MAPIDWKAACVPARAARLSNGLAVVTHRDARSPLVAIHVAYRAGSREEPESRAGLAHLCEHLMFTGTSAAPGSYFAPFERIGATWMNAYVREDYSAYFATVPAWALEFALRMEADRMGHLAAALDDEKIARQREVVRNELRQRAGDRYGRVPAAIASLAHRPGHPYAHPPDGVLEQLDNISTDDVRNWIETRHCAGNAAVVIAGAVEPGSAIDLVRRHFESLPGGSGLVDRADGANPAIEGSRRRTIIEQGGQSRLYLAWNGPRFASSDLAAYQLACEVFASGKASRLWRALERQRLAVDVTFETRPREFGSQAVLATTARAGVPLAAIEAAAERALEEFARDGADPAEVDAARLRIFARLVRGLERVGGPESKSDVLGLAAMLVGEPQAFDAWITAFAAAEPEAVAAAARRWLGRNRAVVEVRGAA
jgi:predicted Zn-dependent peptidase